MISFRKNFGIVIFPRFLTEGILKSADFKTATEITETTTGGMTMNKDGLNVLINYLSGERKQKYEELVARSELNPKTFYELLNEEHKYHEEKINFIKNWRV